MPTIPDINPAPLGQSPAPQPSTSIVPVNASPVPNAMQGVGEAIAAIGDHLNEARRASDLTNALGQATEALGASELKFKRDPDFATVPTRFKSEANDIGNTMASSITDPSVQRVFKQEYAKMALGRQLAVMQNAAGAEQDFNKSNLEQNLETVAHAAAFATNDLDRANNANVARMMIGEMEGARWITHVEATQFQQHFLRRVEEQAIQKDIDTDPIGTFKRLTTDAGYGANMDPIVRSRYEHWARQAAMPNEAKQDAQTAMAGSATFADKAPSGGEPFLQRIRMAESGGDANAVSPKGAKGDMQVMDATKVDPGYGVVPAKDNSPEERSRVGRDYGSAMLAKYGGNETLAAAAYNAGPGKVDQWIQKYGDPRTGAISDADFAAKIPFAETKSYVQRVSAPISQVNGAPSTPRDVRAQLGTWVANAEAQAEKSHPGDAVYRDMVVQQVKGYVGTIAQAQEGVQRQASSFLTGQIMGVNGGPKITSQDQLFASPDTRRAFVQLDAYSQSGILAHVETNARQAAMLETKSAPGLYAGVIQRMYLPDTDPQKITSPLQLLQLVKGDGTGLSVTDFERGKRELTDALTPEGAAFNRDKLTAAHTGMLMLTKSIVGSAQPELAIDAADRFRGDLDNAIDAARKAGKDPRALLTRGGPDYFVTPARVMSYLPGAAQATAQHPTVLAANNAPLPVVKTDADFNALPPGAAFMDPKGARRVKPEEVKQTGVPGRFPNQTIVQIEGEPNVRHDLPPIKPGPSGSPIIEFTK